MRPNFNLMLGACIVAFSTIQAFAGCDDPWACNYNSLDIDSIDCIYPGCTDPAACNFDSTAGCDDGFCDYIDICGICGGSSAQGCLDTSACNYDSSATCDDASCLYPDACEDCGGSGSISGCLDPLSCNFDPTADCDDGSCIGEPGCTDTTASNYNSTAGCDDGSCIVCTGGEYPLVLDMFDASNNGWQGASLTIIDSGGSTMIVDQLSTGDAECNPYCLSPDCYEVIVDEGSSPTDITYEISVADGYNDDYTVFGVANDQQVFSVGGTRGCTSPTAYNYDSNATCDDGSCWECALDPFCVGNQPTGCNSIRINGSGTIHLLDPNGRDRGRRVNNADDLYWEILWGEITGIYRILRIRGDGEGGIEIDFADQTWSDYGFTTCFIIKIDENGGCSIEEYDWENEEIGCTDPNACNYVSTATVDDGTCELPQCDDPLALNYVSTAFCIDNLLCIYTEGCTDSLACNYDSSAVNDNGTCEYSGCTYPNACNYDSTAYCDNGSCDFSSCYGCTETTANNYDPLATFDDGSCTYDTSSSCQSDFNGDCLVNTVDMLEFLSSFGTICIPCE